MTSEFPDPETVRAVLTMATQAPSVHNSQPWRWRVGSESLHLYADLSRHLPRTDPDCREMLVSCGAALHHCTTAPSRWPRWVGMPPCSGSPTRPTPTIWPL